MRPSTACCIGLGSLLGLLLLGAPARPAAAEVRTVEAVGAYPLPKEGSPASAPRDEALQRALTEAVWRVALDELPGRDPELLRERLAEALGGDPLDYATRFRIVEDRGERPALFSESAEVESEYVVLAQVSVDVDRVRARLRQNGLLAPSGERPRRQVRVVLEQMESYEAYAALRQLLADLGDGSSQPRELERGRAVLLVDGHRSPSQLLQQLMRAAPPGLRIVPVAQDAESLSLRISLREGSAAPAPAAIDTQDRNRY